MDDTIYIYIIQLGSQRARHECEAVEIQNNPTDIITWIDGNIESDTEYFNCSVQWRWVTLVENTFYACIIESEDFDNIIDTDNIKFKDIIPEWFDCVSDLIGII